MTLLILSFVAGVLTVAAPCILPILPVIIGGSLLEAGKDKLEKQWIRPLIIAVSLAVSVIGFTLLIKATTALLGVPQFVWQTISGLIVLLLGINFVWPHWWDAFSVKTGLSNKSNAVLGKAYESNGFSSAVLIGVSLGPVFSSCSPTYGLIVATVLPSSFGQGLLYLVAYALGMSATLLLVAYLGQVFVTKLRWMSNPEGWFKRAIGIVFITVSLIVIFGFDKKLQTYILDRGWYDPIGNLERRLSD